MEASYSVLKGLEVWSYYQTMLDARLGSWHCWYLAQLQLGRSSVLL